MANGKRKSRRRRCSLLFVRIISWYYQLRFLAFWRGLLILNEHEKNPINTKGEFCNIKQLPGLKIYMLWIATLSTLFCLWKILGETIFLQMALHMIDGQAFYLHELQHTLWCCLFWSSKLVDSLYKTLMEIQCPSQSWFVTCFSSGWTQLNFDNRCRAREVFLVRERWHCTRRGLLWSFVDVI